MWHPSSRGIKVKDVYFEKYNMFIQSPWPNQSHAKNKEQVELSNDMFRPHNVRIFILLKFNTIMYINLM